jgi:hypothetical protein
MNRFLLAFFAAAALSGCASDEVAVRYGGPLPPQPVMSSDGPVTASGNSVTWDGRGVFSGP